MLTVAVQIDAGNLRFDMTPADIEEITKDQAIRMRTIITDNFLSLGGRNFYGDAAKGTHSSASGNVATVTVSRVGVRLRWLGSDGLDMSRTIEGHYTYRVASIANGEITQHIIGSIPITYYLHTLAFG